MIFDMFVWLSFPSCKACSTSLPSCNQVDGLQLVAHTHAVVLGAALARNIFGSERRCFLKMSVSVCQIAAPFKRHQDNHHTLPYATGRDDLFTLREVELRQSSSSETRFS